MPETVTSTHRFFINSTATAKPSLDIEELDNEGLDIDGPDNDRPTVTVSSELLCFRFYFFLIFSFLGRALE